MQQQAPVGAEQVCTSIGIDDVEYRPGRRCGYPQHNHLSADDRFRRGSHSHRGRSGDYRLREALPLSTSPRSAVRRDGHGHGGGGGEHRRSDHGAESGETTTATEQIYRFQGRFEECCTNVPQCRSLSGSLRATQEKGRGTGDQAGAVWLHQPSEQTKPCLG